MLHILNLPDSYSPTMTQLLQALTEMTKYLNESDHDPGNSTSVTQVGIMQTAVGVLFCQVESLALAEKIALGDSSDPDAQRLLAAAGASSLQLIESSTSLFSSTAQITSSSSH